MSETSETDAEERKKIWLEECHSTLVDVLYGILDWELEQISEQPKEPEEKPAEKPNTSKASPTKKRKKVS